MAKQNRGDFTEVLVRRQTLSPDQVQEARNLQQQTGAKLQDTLVKLGYCTIDEVMSAVAEFHSLQFVNLAEVTIPNAVVELLPEWVPRETITLPMPQKMGPSKRITS